MTQMTQMLEMPPLGGCNSVIWKARRLLPISLHVIYAPHLCHLWFNPVVARGSMRREEDREDYETDNREAEID